MSYLSHAENITENFIYYLLRSMKVDLSVQQTKLKVHGKLHVYREDFMIPVCFLTMMAKYMWRTDIVLFMLPN